MAANDPNPQRAESASSQAPAPWLEQPDIVREVQVLRQQFSAPDLSVPQVLCDQHPPTDAAFIVADPSLQLVPLRYGELAERSRRLASALAERGIGRGSRVGVLMAKGLQMPVVALALWRLGAVYVPLFTAFAGPSIALRVHAAQAALVVADGDQRPKLDGIGVPVLESGAALEQLIAGHAPLARDEAVGADGIFLQLYTSGTTGAPKGVAVPAFAIASFIAYMRYGLDVQASDVLWNGADPGWAYGLYYALVGPLAVGRPNVLLAGGFSSEVAAGVMAQAGVTNFAWAPTVYRALKRDKVRLQQPLRRASSAGEPLTPDIADWAPEA